MIFNNDKTKAIVGSDVKDSNLYVYTAVGNKTEVTKRPFYYYILTEEYDAMQDCGRLGGKNDLQYFVRFQTSNEAYNYKQSLDANGIRNWRCYNDIESAMLREGWGYYGGMTQQQVSMLSFDIETTGVTRDENSFVLLISNTYRSRDGVIIKQLFDFSDYDHPRDMLTSWAKWVRSLDPDIITGHNIFGFDFPYLCHVASLYKIKIHLGRDASPVNLSRRVRQFRKDGSQSYDFNDIRIFGREIVDTFFLSIKYDVQRNYPSYGLKPIMKYEGLEKENRQHWDFSKNKEPWNNMADWTKFKQYAMDDADDALALFDLMIPQFFYYGQHVPKPFQEIINSATGGQVNSFMMRAYLQESKAVPVAAERAPYEGALSNGFPGVYKNVYKVDVASLYPSIMLTYNVEDRKKDPDGKFLEAVKTFTEHRLANKAKAAETGDRLYTDLANGEKIMINSFYGFMGAPGLNFNYPAGASEVTRVGREILTKAINWCESKGFTLVNLDTDSISYEPTNGTINDHLTELNSLMPKGIVWEDDGVYDAVLVIKAKNYALKSGGKIKIKGSGLKATMKEPILASFLSYAIALLLDDRGSELPDIYHSIVRQIDIIYDITPWCSKKTITKSVLNPERTTEARILEAIKGEQVQEGDKIRVFFETPSKLCLDKNFTGVYCKDTLYRKLFDTVKILSTVVDIHDFPNYKLKKNKKTLESL
jgi:DNA polymerase I